MANRGRPKIVNLAKLQMYAYGWCDLFYRWRDGCPGLLSKQVYCGPWKTYRSSVKLQCLKLEDIGRLDHPRRPMRYLTYRYRETKDFAVILISSDKAKKFLRNLTFKGWKLDSVPWPPRPAVWQQFKKAKSVSEIQRVGRTLGWKQLGMHAKEILTAKKLSSYPRKNRPSSDNKRIKFFAKVIAGSECGVAPTTAIKLLSHFPLPDGSVVAHELERRQKISPRLRAEVARLTRSFRNRSERRAENDAVQHSGEE
jgi:hypothetical protein